MSDDAGFEVFPPRSLSQKRWDFICAGILLIPLVALAFQGDVVFGVLERINYRGWYTAIVEYESQLPAVTRQMDAVKAQKQGLDPANPVQRNRLQSLRAEEAKLRVQEVDLKRAIKSRRKPLDKAAARWNFSFVSRWPLSLLLGPLFLGIFWFGIPTDERRCMYQKADEGGVRTWGLVLSLAAVVVFWVAVWQQNALSRELVLNQGTPGYTPSLFRQYAYLLTYLSMAGWSAAAVYAFTGRRGLVRIWLPLAVVMALMILHYGAVSSQWTYKWDTDERWGYGYFIGPIAAMLLYYKLAESRHLVARDKGLWLPGALWRRDPQDGEAAAGAPQAGGAAGRAVLLIWGLAALALTGTAWIVTQYFGKGPVLIVRQFAAIPFIAGALFVVLGLWQRGGGNRRADVAMRLAGVVILVMSIAFRWTALSVPIHYFGYVSMIGVLLGGVLAAFGTEVFRVAWVPVVFLILAIPWPERFYVKLAQTPQLWAAKMAERLMGLIGYTVMRDGTGLQILPGPEGRLAVAEECSGLRMLFAFVALSVVYAYISKRPTWRRVIVFLSSFPIAVAANFIRVFVMALSFRLGYRGITEGLQHEMAGFIIMLPTAFLLLWLEMQVLDLIERLADYLSDEGGSSGSTPRGTGADESANAL